jgi:hypothetical protein
MGRFDRQENEAQDAAMMLESATNELRSSIEREIRDILEVAEARAEEIERHADITAREKERLSERRAEETVERVYSRASRVLDSVELVQSALSGMLETLRAELQGVSPATAGEAALPVGGEDPLDALERGDFPEPQEDEPSLVADRETRYGPPADEQPRPAVEAPERENGVGQPEEERPADESPTEDEPRASRPPNIEEGQNGPLTRATPITPPSLSDEDSPEFDEWFLQHLRNLRETGTSREQTEHFLKQFPFGENYLVALDEVFGESKGENPPARRRGLLRRRRRQRE